MPTFPGPWRWPQENQLWALGASIGLCNRREISVCLDRASQPGLTLPQDVEAGWAPEKLELALTFLLCGTQVCKEQGTAILGMGWVESSPSMSYNRAWQNPLVKPG